MALDRKTIAALVLSASALVGIALNEGYRDQAHIPVPGDVPTDGFGHTKGVRMGDRTTPQRALAALLDDLNERVAGIKECIEVPLYQYEFDAYSSLAYNIGVRAFCESTLVKRLNRSDYPGACKEILRWTKVSGRVWPGLVKRREAEYRTCSGPRAGA